MSLQLWNSNNADVLLDSRLNLFDIMANLCSKLCCEVLLKSWNYIVYLLKWTSALDFNKRSCALYWYQEIQGLQEFILYGRTPRGFPQQSLQGSSTWLVSLTIQETSTT